MKRSPLKRKSGLKARPPRHPKMTADERAQQWEFALVGLLSCAVCGYCHGRNHAHHVVYRQHLPADRAWDRRNALSLCADCHERHHNASARIPRECLTEDNLNFANQVLGEAAGDYLRRRYL